MHCKKIFITGATLIELIFSLTISSLILISLISIYLTADKNLKLQAAMNATQENAEFVLHLIENDIHLAGYIGCARLTADFPLTNHTQYIFNAGNIVSRATNMITVQHASIDSERLLLSMPDQSVLYIPKNLKLKPGNIVMIADCQSAEIFQIQNLELINDKMIKITAATPLKKYFDTQAQLMNLESNTYLIHDSKRKTQHGNFIPALYRKNISNRQSEIAENISAIEFKYAVSNNAVIGVHIAVTFNHYPLQQTWYGYAALH